MKDLTLPSSPATSRASATTHIASILRRIANAFTPQLHSHHVIVRPIEPIEPDRLPLGFRLVVVRRGQEQYLPELIAFSGSNGQGMDADWCRHEIAGGCVMVLALVDPPTSNHPETVAGAAWTANETHSIDPIHHDHDPGKKGCHLLNCFVSPDFRGQRLQRYLLRERVRIALADGKTIAYSFPLTTNTASVRNQFAEGLIKLMRIDVIKIAGLKLINFRRLSHQFPLGKYIPKGGWGSDSLRLIR